MTDIETRADLEAETARMTPEALDGPRAMPSTIYAWPSDVTPLCGSWAQTRYPEDAVPFIRRDAPELVALVDAANGAIGHMTGYGEASTARINLRAALDRLRKERSK